MPREPARPSIVRAEVRPDVSEAVGTGERLRTAVTVVAPAAPRPRPLVFAGFPGATYTRRYYDLEIPGHAGYSQAEYHASRGDVFLCCDHPGVGDSDTPAKALDYDAVGRANAAAVRQVVAALAEGDLPGVPAVEAAAAVGLGQSFGGFCLVIGQVVDPAFDAVAFLGWSSIATLPPYDPDLDPATFGDPSADGLDHPLRTAFHHPTEPDEIVRLDMTRRGGWDRPRPGGRAPYPEVRPSPTGAGPSHRGWSPAKPPPSASRCSWAPARSTWWAIRGRSRAPTGRRGT